MRDDSKQQAVQSSRLDRRSLLKAVGAGSTATIAGCASLPKAGGGGGKLKMGGVLPLTGALADPAEWIKRAWNLAVDQVNKNGGILGKEVDLTIYDTELNKSKMQSQTSKLITQDNVDVFLGPYPTITAPVISPILERNGMTVLHMFWPASHIRAWKNGEGKWPHQFGFSAGSYTYPRAMVKYISSLPSDVKPERIALIGRNDIYGKDSAWAWKHFMDKFGDFKLVGSEYYEPGSTDMTAQTRKLKDKNPDLIASNSYMGGSTLVMKAIADVGLNPDFIWASVGPQIPSWIPALKATGEYVFGSTPYAYSVPTKGNEKLYKTAQEKWGKKPHYSFGFGFIQFQIYKQLLESIGEVNNDKMMEKMQSMTFDTVTGKIGFENNFSNAPMFVTQVQDKEIPVVWPDKHKTADAKVPLPDEWPNQSWP